MVPLKKTDVKEPLSIKVCISYSAVIRYQTKKSARETALHCRLQIPLIRRRNSYFVIDDKDKETKSSVLALSGKFLNTMNKDRPT